MKFWDPLSGRDILTLGGTSAGGGNTSRIAFANPAGLVLVNEVDGLRVYDGRPWTPPPVVAAKPTPPEPKQDAPADERPDAVKTAVAQSVAALDARDPAAAALHTVAARGSGSRPGPATDASAAGGSGAASDAEVAAIAPAWSDRAHGIRTGQGG